MLKLSYLTIAYLALTFLTSCQNKTKDTQKPNIVIVIADDWSWPHAGVYGVDDLSTPNVNKLAVKGVVFTNAFCSTSSCSPSRAALLTGRNSFELEEGATLWGYLPAKFPTYTELLEKNGYRVGASGKGWGPGLSIGRKVNPVGKLYNGIFNDPYPDFGDKNCVSDIDYIANMEQFLNSSDSEKPFCFWIGVKEPHRGYKPGFAAYLGIDAEKVNVPAFLPDVEEVREDIAEYYAEVQHVDKQVGLLMELLKKRKKLNNTIIVVTSDNGMPFPRGKATCYDYGVHMPLIVWWGNNTKKGRTVTDMVSFTDLAPTFLEVAGVNIPTEMSGKSILPLIKSGKSGRIDHDRNKVYTCRERHAFTFENGTTTAARAIRTDDYLLIWNAYPQRAPKDVDGGPTKDFMIQNKDDYPELYELFAEPKGQYELYDVKNDKYQMINLVNDPKYQTVFNELKNDLINYLKERKDPRALGQWKKLVYIPYFGFLPKEIKVKNRLELPLEISLEEIFEKLKMGYIKIGEEEHFNKMMEIQKGKINGL